MGAGETGGNGDLRAALEAFHRAPERYVPHGPAIVYSNLRQVLQYAAGRVPGEEGSVDAHLQRTAQSFVRHALLRRGSNHYELLGLQRSCAEGQVKEHYRLLMRLLHPDFADAASGIQWPPDAASRINLAYEALGSSDKRQAYDRSLERPANAPVARPAAATPATQPAPIPVSSVEYPRSVLKLLAAGFGFAGALAGIAYFIGTEQDAPQFLVRSEPPSAPPAERGGGATGAALAAWNAITAPFISTEAKAPAPTAPHESSRASKPVAASPEATQRSADPPIDAPPPPAVAVQEMPLAPPAAPPAPPIVAAAPAPAPVPAPVPAPAPAAVPAPVPVAAAAPVRPVPQAVADVTMAQAHPIISQLLSQAQTGASDRVLSVLERDVRYTPAAQSFARYYADLVGDGRVLRVRNAQFRSEPRDGKLVVVGHLTLDLADASGAATYERPLALEAEFTRRRGNVVITRLSKAGE